MFYQFYLFFLLCIYGLYFFSGSRVSSEEVSTTAAESAELPVESVRNGGELSRTIEIEERPPVVETDTFDPSLNFGFSFDEQPGLEDHPGPSPSVILQVLSKNFHHIIHFII